MKEDSIIFTRLRSYTRPVKSTRYMKWVKEKHPGKDFHHLLGSMGKMKLSDYLGVCLTREEHNWADRNRAQAFIQYLPGALNNLFEYIQELEQR